MSKKYLVLYKNSEGEWHNEFNTLKAVVQDLEMSWTTGVVYERIQIDQKRKKNIDPLSVDDITLNSEKGE